MTLAHGRPLAHVSPHILWWSARRARRMRLLLLATSGEAPASATGARASAAAEEDAAFEAFFRRHERAIFGYLWRMTGDEQTAYDLSQETFVRAWRHFGRISGYDRPDAWLFRVATNLALNHRRARATAILRAEPLRGGEADVDERFARSDPALRLVEDDAVRRALMALPPRRRAALILRAAYDMSSDEVARALGISRDAAKMLIFRGRDEFRRRYDAEGGAR